MRPEAVDAMVRFLGDEHGNPSGVHRPARRARRALDDARDAVAEVVGAAPGEVVFTSGGTEADNLAVLGVHDRVGGVLVAAATEHHAVLDPVRSRDHRLVPVGADGTVDLAALASVLDEAADAAMPVSLVSVMTVNNEVGTVQPLAEVAAVVRSRAPHALLHTDAVQAVTWLDVARSTAGADLVSISAHKFGGPKGVGALVVRGGASSRLGARQSGGGQERDRRSGTQNVAGIVALGVAIRAAAQDRAATVARVSRLRHRLVDGLRGSVDGLLETARPDAAASCRSVPGIAHVCIPGVDAESLLFLLDRDEVYASAAASCASGAMEPSHVLAAMGVPQSLAQGSLRLSLGWSSTDDDVDRALATVPVAVERIRRSA